MENREKKRLYTLRGGRRLWRQTLFLGKAGYCGEAPALFDRGSFTHLAQVFHACQLKGAPLQHVELPGGTTGCMYGVASVAAGAAARSIRQEKERGLLSVHVSLCSARIVSCVVRGKMMRSAAISPPDYTFEDQDKRLVIRPAPSRKKPSTLIARARLRKRSSASHD